MRWPASATAASPARPASPSILNASPEAAIGGGLALLRTGDRVRIDLNKATANILIDDEELARRRAELQKRWRLSLSQAPDALAGNPALHGRPFSEGMVLKPAIKYQDVAHTSGIPRDNH